jgi:hypothetical protein
MTVTRTQLNAAGFPSRTTKIKRDTQAGDDEPPESQRVLHDVWCDDEVTALNADKSNLQDIPLERGFHVWRWNISDERAEQIEGEPYAQG